MTPSLIHMPKVFHIGTLDPTQKATRFHESFEGPCLSVSTHPEAWRRIAKLGDAPMWELKHPTGTFLDIRTTLRASEFVRQLQHWGVASNWVQPQRAWLARWYDDESEDILQTTWDSRDAAEQEVADPTEILPDGEPALTPQTVFSATARLQEWLGYSPGLRDVTDMLALRWAEETCPLCVGAWWSDRLEPASYSAPRGGILPSRLAEWAVRQV